MGESLVHVCFEQLMTSYESRDDPWSVFFARIVVVFSRRSKTRDRDLHHPDRLSPNCSSRLAFASRPFVSQLFVSTPLRIQAVCHPTVRLDAPSHPGPIVSQLFVSTPIRIQTVCLTTVRLDAHSHPDRLSPFASRPVRSPELFVSTPIHLPGPFPWVIDPAGCCSQPFASLSAPSTFVLACSEHPIPVRGGLWGAPPPTPNVAKGCTRRLKAPGSRDPSARVCSARDASR